MSDLGYPNPPISTRFPKGQSGNPKGRPKGRHNEPPYEAVFGQMVTIKEDGVERRVKADEAFLLHALKRGIDVGGAAAQYTLATLKEARAARAATSFPFRGIVHVLVTPGSVNTALKPLRMAKKLDGSARVRKRCSSRGSWRPPLRGSESAGPRFESLHTHQ